jgi:hypothetical protein
MVEESSESMILASAEATEKYKMFLIDSWVELSQLNESIMMNMLHGKSDFDTTNAYLSRLINLLIQFYPKVEGGGERTADLQQEFDVFKPWIYNPSIPIESEEEGNKVPELLFLIRRAYERFNLTSFR